MSSDPFGKFKPLDDDCVVEVPIPERSKSFVEQLLSPQALQWMMACGGGILVLGFVGWLWSIGVFENPLAVAAGIGLATIGPLVVGLSLVRFTRYEQAGTGLSLLASLAMPLNLWFYNAQGLITIDQGGHLWIPAAFCCGIYALTAVILRKPMFVYTLVGGIVLTGMLFLADQDVSRFWELTGPVTFLVSFGWACMFSDRFFASGFGAFSQENFGYAFRNAGHVLVGAGLLLLLGGQVSGLMELSLLGPDLLPTVTTDPDKRLWATAIVLISAIGFVGEYFLRGRNSNYLSFATVLGVWGVACLAGVLQVQPQLSHLVILAAIGLIVRNLAATQNVSSDSNVVSNHTEDQEATAWFFATILAILGVIQFASQFVSPNIDSWLIAPTGWLAVAQLLITAVACATTGVRTASQDPKGQVTATNLASGWAGVLGVMAAVTAASVLQIQWLDGIATLGFSIPLSLKALTATRILPGQQVRGISPAGLSVVTLVGCLIMLMLSGVPAWSTHWTWAWILAGATVVCFEGWQPNHYSCYLFGLGTIWQIMAALGVDFELTLPAAATVAGLVFAVVNTTRSRRDRLSEVSSSRLPANLMMFTGSGLGMLLAVSRVLADQANTGLIWLLAGQLAAVAIAGFLAERIEWRHAYRALAVATVFAIMFVCNSMVDVNWVHKLELASLVTGLTLLAIGHIGWFREGEQEDDVATACLWAGSLLIAMPLAAGLIYYRVLDMQSESGWILFHEIASIVAGLLLFGLGVACRIRSTTIAGVASLSVYAFTLLTLVQWPDQLKSVSVVMMVGGGLFFAAAVLLSIYRDKIVNVPTHIREKRGVFRVMRWR